MASVQQKLRYGNMTGALARVHEDSSHVTIPSVDNIVHEFTLRSMFFPLEPWQLPYLAIPNSRLWMLGWDVKRAEGIEG